MSEEIVGEGIPENKLVETLLFDQDGKKISVTPVEAFDPSSVKDRLTAVLQIYHQHHGFPIISADLRYDDQLDEFDIEPFVKPRLKVGPEWRPFSFGDHEPHQVGTIIIHNLAGTAYARLPSAEERAAVKEQVIQLRLRDSNGMMPIVRPNRFCKLELASVDGLEIRCLNGSCNAEVWVFSK